MNHEGHDDINHEGQEEIEGHEVKQSGTTGHGQC